MRRDKPPPLKCEVTWYEGKEPEVKTMTREEAKAIDPKSFDSGKSVHKKTRISKAGNSHVRAALYMPAMNAVQHDQHVKAYFQHLADMGKLPMQGLCAVMRKLLHAIHGMLKHDKPFDNTRFYANPISAG